MKRYCQTLILVDDEALIAKYVEVHAHVWPEVIQGQREVGILDMQIYRRGRSLFMIMDKPVLAGLREVSCNELNNYDYESILSFAARAIGGGVRE